MAALNVDSSGPSHQLWHLCLCLGIGKCSVLPEPVYSVKKSMSQPKTAGLSWRPKGQWAWFHPSDVSDDYMLPELLRRLSHDIQILVGLSLHLGGFEGVICSLLHCQAKEISINNLACSLGRHRRTTPSLMIHHRLDGSPSLALLCRSWYRLPPLAPVYQSISVYFPSSCSIIRSAMVSRYTSWWDKIINKTVSQTAGTAVC